MNEYNKELLINIIITYNSITYALILSSIIKTTYNIIKTNSSVKLPHY